MYLFFFSSAIFGVLDYLIRPHAMICCVRYECYWHVYVSKVTVFEYVHKTSSRSPAKDLNQDWAKIEPLCPVFGSFGLTNIFLKSLYIGNICIITQLHSKWIVLENLLELLEKSLKTPWIFFFLESTNPGTAFYF